MQQLKKHIIFRSLAICIAMTILVPSAVKLSHALEHQNHEVVQCLDQKSDAHLHEYHIDCEFYKFKLNNKYSLLEYTYQLSVEFNYFKVNSKINHLHIDHNRLTTFLRGPPLFV